MHVNWKYVRKYTEMALLITLFAVANIGRIHALESHKFRLGTDATVKISFELNENSQYCWEMFRMVKSEPFCINGTIMPNALRPDQRGRFDVNITRNEATLSMELRIQRITEGDKGVYVLAVKEHLETGDRTQTRDVYIDVILPPGNCDCTVLESPYSSRLREVHCRATVGSDRGGLLICYQRKERAPFQSPPVISATHVTAVFWMEATAPIECCSHEPNYDKGPGDCHDFTQSAIIEPPPTASKRPIMTNPAKDILTGNSKATSSAITRTFSSIQETTNFPSVSNDKCDCQGNMKLHYIYGSVIALLFFAMLILIITNIITAKALKKNSKKSLE